jgi:hypothetical protein
MSLFPPPHRCNIVRQGRQAGRQAGSPSSRGELPLPLTKRHGYFTLPLYATSLISVILGQLKGGRFFKVNNTETHKYRYIQGSTSTVPRYIVNFNATKNTCNKKWDTRGAAFFTVVIMSYNNDV